MFSTFSFRISGPKAFAFHPQLNSSHLCCPHFSSPQPHVSSDRGGSLLPGLIVSTFMGRVVSLVRIVQCISMAAKLKLTDLNIISGTLCGLAPPHLSSPILYPCSLHFKQLGCSFAKCFSTSGCSLCLGCSFCHSSPSQLLLNLQILAQMLFSQSGLYEASGVLFREVYSFSL